LGRVLSEAKCVVGKVTDLAGAAFIVWRCEVISSWMAVLKPLATIFVAASAARGFVAFATWRKSFRSRLIGGEPYSGEAN
jgi:hypothetical protein